MIRAERAGPTELRVTITSRRDVGDAAGETVCRTESVSVALHHVLEFLAADDAAWVPPDPL